ncbi:indolepyruvate ferredoxin oxidoreductase family protein [Asticcacaulis sp. ZE23SCel15]|uniref:indolepyruvate ferredoxin oxidoreductase family protein n=1 Tax=Asticcacaulis sp. ZE23SCel15 TaxID=3059027 RepID=UPI00265D6FEA|nr:indolepyruvate ferredoxin oxidoreductase family protein [Asticcacaulis sp. ZE23SCel15]WKL58364.1 indolepyruvate ferredoxin oxidoreductase family protein [Asticcacaulis sp. ZE23SCel15]
MRTGVTLEDKYRLNGASAYMTGVQALVKLPLMIAARDRLNGLNTGGFISGYRGSPLGTYDLQLEQAKAYLDAADIVVQPAVNEDLGAAAVWGSQHVPLFSGAKKDGVFGLWYAKSPGVDRSGDALKHANMAGTSRYGGVVALVGDDPACKSSSLPNQSDHALIDAEIPIIAPSSVEEILDFGLRALEMSRFAGCWVALKTVSDLMDGGASITLPSLEGAPHLPDIDLPPEGLHIRVPDPPQAKEFRHRHFRLPAAVAFGLLNSLDRIALNAPRARLGIVASGKVFHQVMEALTLLGLDAVACRDIGLRVWKVGMVWPLDAQAATTFARGLETVLVIEERRDVIESQLRNALYPLPNHPRILGKKDADGHPLVSEVLELETVEVALAIAHIMPDGAVAPERLRMLMARHHSREQTVPIHVRKPYFCAGCPHSRSTTLPEGSRALAGIGCHYMATFLPRRSELYTHMGAEGITWMGQAPFTDEAHVFANLGDGTYFHSGILAVRQAVAANLNITYKILYNDAVAMTGGQAVDGYLTPALLAAQVAAEGVKCIVFVSPEPDRWRKNSAMPAGVTFRHRDDLEAVQTELRATKGVTVLLYDQACATEMRRRRKRGHAPALTQRVFINERVCEGCADCSVKSACIAVTPKDTEFGIKREIDQSACNVDTSCLNGFCPSFVTLEGAQVKRAPAGIMTGLISDLPEVMPPALTSTFNLLITGIGGLGVTSLGAILGMAAHIDGLQVTAVDQQGLAQRGGGVDSHLRLSPQGAGANGPRIPLGQADVVIAADMVQAHAKSTLPLMNPDKTVVALNADLTSTADFTVDTRTRFDRNAMTRRVRLASKTLTEIKATGLARRYLGDAVYVNMILLGAVWQAGLIPLSRAAITQAIRLNGADVETNLRAFALGRAHAAGRVTEAAPPSPAFDLDAFVARRVADLTAYQNAAYAEDYLTLVDRARATGHAGFTEAVARNFYKLKAYKDEYEVARLHTDPQMTALRDAQFEGATKVSVWLAPPLLARKDPTTGVPKKMRFGPWIFSAFAVLKRFKALRGTPFDPFGATQERRLERQMIDDYRVLITRLCAVFTPAKADIYLALARLPEEVRGFGHIKLKSIQDMQSQRDALMARLSRPVAKTEISNLKEAHHV